MVNGAEGKDPNFLETSPIHAGKIPEEVKHARFSHVLANVNFLLLWFSQLVSQLADRFLLYVLLIFAYQTTRSNLGASLPMLAFGIPSVLFAPGAGVLVDRLNRKYVMVFSGLLRGLFILSVIPFVNGSVAAVFGISLIIFTFTQFFAPAETSSIPQLVEKRDLIAANSLFLMTLMGASIIGIGLAAPLTGWMGEKSLLLLAAGLQFAAALATFCINLKHTKIKVEFSVVALIKDLLEGFGVIKSEPLVSYSLFKLFFATSILATICLLAVSFSEQILKIGAANFGYLVFAAGIGMILGGIFIGKYSHYFKKGQLVTVGFLTAGVALIALAEMQNLWWVLGLVFVLGAGNAFITAPLQTILHENVPAKLQGRVFGVQNMIINSAFTFPVVIFGQLADIYGLRAIIWVLGVLVLLGGFFDRFISKFKDA
ncbi:MAG: MFS transporter [Candidatus Margulisiibacteriota bacterium]